MFHSENSPHTAILNAKVAHTMPSHATPCLTHAMLCLHCPALFRAQRCDMAKYWLPPLEMKAGLDFKIWEVARTTSAAPAFLPRKLHAVLGFKGGPGWNLLLGLALPHA